MWKEIVDTTRLPFYGRVSSFDCPVVESLFNGAIHWLVLLRCDFVIVAFQLRERKLLEIS